AIDRGMVTYEQADTWTDPEWLELLFRPNFSTAGSVTSISGRGIGLDIVRQRVQELGGYVELSYSAGLGTTIEMQVPIGLLTPRVLLVRCGELQVSVATSDIERVFPFRASQTENVDGQVLVRWQGVPIPVV